MENNFKDGDIVRIKAEWCNGDFERRSLYVVSNVNEEMQRCLISLIDVEHRFPFGSSENCSFNMIEKVGFNVEEIAAKE